MTRRIRLTPRGRTRLVDILRWTAQTFGPNQAARYEALLYERAEALAGDAATARTCDLLTGDAAHAGLIALRAGEHFLICAMTPDELTITDILHSRADLPRHISDLMGGDKDD